MNNTNLTSSLNNENGYIFCTYIVRKGKTIYPKKGKYFKIPVNSFKKKK